LVKVPLIITGRITQKVEERECKGSFNAGKKNSFPRNGISPPKLTCNSGKK